MSGHDLAIDHVSLHAGDYQRMRAFYTAALAPLGLGVTLDLSAEQAGGVPGMSFGPGRGTVFWLGGAGQTRPTAHIAFRAKSRAEVDAFYKAALAAGGRDNGPPGLRTYAPGYYAAFVLDPEGHNIEAVTYAD